MGNANYSSLTTKTRNYFNKNDAYVNDEMLEEYLNRRINSLDLDDVPIYILIAYRFIHALAIMHKKTPINEHEQDIDEFRREVGGLFEKIKSKFPDVVPQWLSNLLTIHQGSKAPSAAEIIREFERNYGGKPDESLYYCKRHLGIPLLITKYMQADGSKYGTVKNQILLEEVKEKESLEGITFLDYNGFDRNYLDDFITTVGRTVISIKKYGEDRVIAYCATGSTFPPNHKIKDFPIMCQNINLYKRLDANKDSAEYIYTLKGIIDSDGEGRLPFMILEGDPGISLKKFLEDLRIQSIPLQWFEILRIACDIAKGLKFLHENNVLHKMLNTHTVRMSKKKSVKLTGFGLFIDCSSETSGGRGWCAAPPEFKENNLYSSAGDVYAFGLILTDLLEIKSCEKMDSVQSVFAAFPTSCPQWYQQLFLKCTRTDHTKRPSVDSIIQELEAHIENLMRDGPRDSIALMELNNKSVTQLAVTSTSDIVNVYGGTYNGMAVSIKRPNENPNNKNIDPLDMLYNEVVVSCRIQSRNIVNQFGIFDCNTASPAVIIEHFDRGSLNEYLLRIADVNELNHATVVYIAACVAQAILDLHEIGIVHCNVHSSNVFLDSSCAVKLGNLMLAQPEGMPLSDIVKELVPYLAPEVAEGRPYTTAADVYAFGKFLSALNTCEQDESQAKDAPKAENRHPNKSVEELAVKCCKDDPKSRLTMAQVVEDLRKQTIQFCGDSILKAKLKGVPELKDILKDVPELDEKAIKFKNVFETGGKGSIQRGIMNEQVIALKRVDAAYNEKNLAAFVREAQILYKFRESKYVVKMHGVLRYDGYHYIVMDFHDDDLSKSWKKTDLLTWKSRVKLALNIIRAIKSLHEMKIAHLDIKLLNILWAGNDEIKVIDFGESQEISDLQQEKMTKNLCEVGTLCYMAPELFHVSLKTNFVEKIDVYAVGVVLSEIFTLKTDKCTLSKEQHRKSKTDGTYSLDLTCCNEDVREIIKKCVEYNPRHRISIKELEYEMEKIYSEITEE